MINYLFLVDVKASVAKCVRRARNLAATNALIKCARHYVVTIVFHAR